MLRSTTEQVAGAGRRESMSGPNMRGLGTLFTIARLMGLAAAVVLLVDKIALIENPDYAPTCSINPVLSCGLVMTTSQAEAFGIPNPIIGIAGSAVVAVIGAGILAGRRHARWFWTGVQVGVTFAVVFVHLLIFQSLYVTGALCPYCMIVWAVTFPVFWHTTIRDLILIRWRGPPAAQRLIHVLIEFRGAIITAWHFDHRRAHRDTILGLLDDPHLIGARVPSYRRIVA